MDLGNGPGKYDDICTYVREQTMAEGVVLLVFNGSQGGGFSAQVNDLQLIALPNILEEMARGIRADLAAKAGAVT